MSGGEEVEDLTELTKGLEGLRCDQVGMESFISVLINLIVFINTRSIVQIMKYTNLQSHSY